MGLPQENREDFVKGSPMTYAKNLKGNLLYIHGTGDDNVHYNNNDMLINELVKYNKHVPDDGLSESDAQYFRRRGYGPSFGYIVYQLSQTILSTGSSFGCRGRCWKESLLTIFILIVLSV